MRGAHDIAAPTDPIVVQIHRYWDEKRGTRRMPNRTDIDPAELGRLVVNVLLYEVLEPGKLYRIRLVGGAIVDFYGVNTTGELAGAAMPPAAAAQMSEILNSIVANRAPRFRAGFAHWHKDRSYRKFEACFLPLSPDDDRVDKILGRDRLRHSLAGQDRRRLDFDERAGIDEAPHFDRGHRREMPAHDGAIGRADFAEPGAVVGKIGHVPGEAHDMLGLGARRLEHVRDVLQCLLRLCREALRESAVDGAAPLPRDTDDAPLGRDGVGKALGRRPAFGMNERDHMTIAMSAASWPFKRSICFLPSRYCCGHGAS